MSETGFTESGNIVIKLGTDTYRGNYLKDLEILEARLNEMLMTQPAKYVFWARMWAVQRVIHEKRKFDLEKYSAQIYTFIRNEKESAGEKVTEKIVEMAMLRDTKYEEMKNAVMRERLRLDHLTAVRDAFSQRKDCLMSLSANLREEYDSTLALKEKQFADERLKRTMAKKE